MEDVENAKNISTCLAHRFFQSRGYFTVERLSKLDTSMDRLFGLGPHLRVIVPVQVLQVVGGQDVDVAATANTRVIDDALRVAALQ